MSFPNVRQINKKDRGRYPVLMREDEEPLPVFAVFAVSVSLCATYILVDVIGPRGVLA